MKTLIVEDHPIFRAGLQILLKESVAAPELCEAPTLRDAQQLLRSQRGWGLIIIDLLLPDGNGLSLLGTLQELGINAPAVVISACSNKSDIQSAADAGAQGYILKSSPYEQMVADLGKVIMGHTIFPTVEDIDQPMFSLNASIGKNQGITPRQLDVLDLMARGNSNRRIADQLSLTENTVKSHVSALLQTFAADNRTECVIAAERTGVIRRHAT